MSTYYNKINYDIKESPEQNMIESPGNVYLEWWVLSTISETIVRFFVQAFKTSIQHSQNYSQKSKKITFVKVMKRSRALQGQNYFLAKIGGFHFKSLYRELLQNS